MKQSTDAARLVPDRAEREGEERLLQIAIAIEEHPLIFQIGSLARQRALERLADHRPGRSPAFREILSRRMGVLGATDRPIAIVVDLRMVRSPNERNRKIGGDAEAHGGAQTLRPALDRTE